MRAIWGEHIEEWRYRRVDVGRICDALGHEWVFRGEHGEGPYMSHLYTCIACDLSIRHWPIRNKWAVWALPKVVNNGYYSGEEEDADWIDVVRDSIPIEDSAIVGRG